MRTIPIRHPKGALVLLLCTGLAPSLHAQLITEGAPPFIFQQMDNLSGSTNNWTRAVGVGYFNQFVPGLLTEPESFLHVYSEGIPPSSPIPNAETFRTTVASGNSQFWRMERNDLEIGQLYHYSSFDHFRIRAVQPPADLILENEALDGIRICASGQPATLNGFNLDRQGFSTFGSAVGWGQAQAWSRIHLAHETIGTVPIVAYRPWMRNGALGMGNSDLFYIGHKYDMGAQGIGPEVDDNSNVVVAFGDDALPSGLTHHYDNFQFRYVGENSVAGSAGTVDGLEIMRLRPFRLNASSDIEGFVGIGDWSAFATGPEERLDILNGTVRLRDFSPVGNTNYLRQTANVNRVLVADETDGKVYWRPMTDFTDPAATDCDWEMNSGNVVTAHKVSPGALCPGKLNNVGIGTALPTAKLHVEETTPTLGAADTGLLLKMFTDQDPSKNSTGLWVQSFPIVGVVNSDDAAGIRVSAYNGGTRTSGIIAEGYAGSDNLGPTYGVLGNGVMQSGYTGASTYGVYGKTDGPGTSTNRYGVYGESGSTGTSSDRYGVYGKATVGASSGNGYGVYGWAVGHGAARYVGVYGTFSGNGADNWAVWSQGRQFSTTSSLWSISDAQFKTEVEDITNASDILVQLQPKTFLMDTANFGFMNFEDRLQYGLIAQEVESILPALVRDVNIPEELDSLGNMVSPAVQAKAMQYGPLLPIVIAGFNEQQVLIQQQQAQLDEQMQRLDMLEQDLMACCASNGDGTFGMQQQGGGNEGNNTPVDLKKNDDRLTIVPNPFQEQTTLSYLLDASAMVQLQVTTERGLHLATLRQQQQEAGAYSMTWNTQDLAPGVYYVSLYADGKPIVKKAVKVK